MVNFTYLAVYSRLPACVDKCVAESEYTQEILRLVQIRTDTLWTQALNPYYRCYLYGRLKFGNPRNGSVDLPEKATTFHKGALMKRNTVKNAVSAANDNPINSIPDKIWNWSKRNKIKAAIGLAVALAISGQMHTIGEQKEAAEEAERSAQEAAKEEVVAFPFDHDYEQIAQGRRVNISGKEEDCVRAILNRQKLSKPPYVACGRIEFSQEVLYKLQEAGMSASMIMAMEDDFYIDSRDEFNAVWRAYF